MKKYARKFLAAFVTAIFCSRSLLFQLLAKSHWQSRDTIPTKISCSRSFSAAPRQESLAELSAEAPPPHMIKPGRQRRRQRRPQRRRAPSRRRPWRRRRGPWRPGVGGGGDDEGDDDEGDDQRRRAAASELYMATRTPNVDTESRKGGACE